MSSRKKAVKPEAEKPPLVVPPIKQPPVEEPTPPAPLVKTEPVRTTSGSIVEVPIDHKESQRANQVLAAQMRQLIMDNVKTWKDSEAQLSTLDIKNIVAAAREVVDMSGGAFGGENLPAQVRQELKPRQKFSFEEIITKQPDGAKNGS